MKDIDEALNEIIFKYNVDSYYPHYRNMYKAEKILLGMITEMIQRQRKAVFVGDEKTGIEFIRNISGDYNGIQFLSYDRNDRELKDLSKIGLQEYDKVYLISFYGAEYAERWFRLHNIQYEWIYDIFEREGIILQREFFIFAKEDLQPLIHTESHTSYGRTESIQCEFYCQREKYETANDVQTKRIALEKCLFLALYMKNFLAAKEYASLLSGEDAKFEGLWDEIQELLDTIKKSVRKRERRDIILYWLDAIAYGDESNMPYLQGIKNDSIVFENAFTYIYWTRPTLRAMFLGKRDIDDLSYNISEISGKNSQVIRFLEDHGYKVKVFSGYYANNFPVKYRARRLYSDMFQPISMCLWDMLSEMLTEKVCGGGQMLWVVHAFATHSPYINGKMKDDNYRNEAELYSLAKQEIDEQLSFYETYISDSAFRIYMSDHGGHRDITRFHILFNIYHKALTPRKVEGMFSLLNFGTVLKQIITDGNIKEEDLVGEYAAIGGLDWYNQRVVERVFQKKETLSGETFGCKGVVDKEYIYIRYKTGKEWLQKRKDMLLLKPLLFYNGLADVCEPALLPKYRELTGEWPKEMELDDKFKYSRYLYALYRNVLKHNNMPERVRLINELFDEYPAGSIGIRLGGYHSAVLYYILSEENRKKIWGFIDSNAGCLCSKLQLPIVNLDWMDNLEKNDVRAILLSSYTNLEMLRKESVSYPAGMAVLNIYDCLSMHGIQCQDNFWVIKETDEDYDVGFMER